MVNIIVIVVVVVFVFVVNISVLMANNMFFVIIRLINYFWKISIQKSLQKKKRFKMESQMCVCVCVCVCVNLPKSDGWKEGYRATP